tara:strand:- start:1862 stop:2965 length:1104 start_codon:yes stop_codon:yes gene_type:complete
MSIKPLKIVLVSTPVGHIGSGKGGGVELTLTSLLKGLSDLGHEVILVTPEGSTIPNDCNNVSVKYVSGVDQPSWQHQEFISPIVIPFNGILPRLWDEALKISQSADAILNFGYDWLPIWLSRYVTAEIFHLISMGAVSEVMKNVIEEFSFSHHSKLAFHTFRQASDYQLVHEPRIVGNGFDLKNYCFQSNEKGPIGWVGRISPEKGLEDAVSLAASLGEKIIVWGLKEDEKYASNLEEKYPSGTIDWRGFLPTKVLQEQLGFCRALINTPKWNEAYGNVVVEAMACGVPVIAYDRGGPGEIIIPGQTGWITPPDDIEAMKVALSKLGEIDRKDCRQWVEKFASKEVFAKRVEDWIVEVIHQRQTFTS